MTWNLPLSKCLFMILFRLQNSLKRNPTPLLLITGALEQWCLNVLQDLDLSCTICSHLPGKALTLQEAMPRSDSSCVWWSGSVNQRDKFTVRCWGWWSALVVSKTVWMAIYTSCGMCLLHCVLNCGQSSFLHKWILNPKQNYKPGCIGVRKM